MVTPIQAITARITKLGLSQRRLAAMLGVSQPALNAWLNGYTRPPATFVEQATKVLDVEEEAQRAADAARQEVLARSRRQQACPTGSPAAGHVGARSERNPPDLDVAPDDLPDVLFLGDLAALLRCHPKTIRRRIDARVFPVAPIPGIDRRPRWSKAAVLQWLAAGGSLRKPRARASSR